MSEEQDRLAREIWESRNDPEEWSDEAEDIEVQPRFSAVVSFRLQEDELDDVEEAMEETGETLSQFIRGAINMRLHSESTDSIMKGSA